MKRCFFYTLLFFCSLLAHAQPDTTQHVDLKRLNGPEKANTPYLILISSDGFRYDYAEKYEAATLLALRNQGVQAKSLIPSFPSLTFPNHYSIATGLYPSHHGIINNIFYDAHRKDFYVARNREKVGDGTWYGGLPLWVLAEQQQLLSACFYWPGSEAAIKDVRPSYYYLYNEKITIDQRIQAVVDWLSLPPDRRPHLITFYLSEVDQVGHLYGGGTAEVGKAVHLIDSAVLKLTEAVKKIGLENVNYIFLSDHGMATVDPMKFLPMPAVIDSENFIIPSGGVIVDLHAKNKASIQSVYQRLRKNAVDYQVYLKKEVPTKLHYRADDDRMNRIGDIVLIANWPKFFNFSNKKASIGCHGYDPSVVPDMLGTFYAWGPAFKKNLTIAAFENVHIYPVVTELLGLTYSHAIDGTKELSTQILAK